MTDQSNPTLTPDNLYPTLKREFEKIAYLKSGILSADDFQQEMWLVLYEWIADNGYEGRIGNGKVLLAQKPQYIAIFCAGRARKHIHRATTPSRREADLILAAGEPAPAAEPQEVLQDEEELRDEILCDAGDEERLVSRIVRCSGGRLSAKGVKKLISDMGNHEIHGAHQRQSIFLFLRLGNLREVQRLGGGRKVATRFRQALVTQAG